MKTEKEFLRVLKKSMRHARRKKSLHEIARQMNIQSGHLLGCEMGYIPISAYQLYVFIHATQQSPEFITRIFD